MSAIRVLVVDDSAVIRRVLCDVLAEDPEIEVAATAPNGSIALAKIPRVNPDLVTLDIEMPVMDGLETLKEIRKLYPKLPVIMFSTLTERGATSTLEALALGASDYATKPSNSDSSAGARDQIRLSLIPKIKSLAGVRGTGLRAEKPSPVRRPIRRGIDIVAIGTSTGGPNALGNVVPQFSGDFPVPIVIVQHMPPLFTRFLAERLNSLGRLKVCEGEADRKLEPGQVWIAPGNYHMTVARKGTDVVLQLNQNPPENFCRPAVDVLFRSVAETYGANVLGVVMTGMGSDGLRGSREIREAGGEILVQDEATSVVWGMPGAVAAAGQADQIYPLERLTEEVTLRVNSSRSSSCSAATLVTK
jgi:two-component system chemotaxis response regulator CheB